MKLITHCVVGIILLVGLCACAAAQATQELGRRGEWLSWTPVQRNAYVYGLVDGYLMGFSRACDLADQLFEVGKPQRLGNDPSARCMAHRGEFSKKSPDKEAHYDISAYTDVITAFYENHTSCRDFPFALLLQALSSKYATADELYELALKGGLKGLELRPLRKNEHRYAVAIREGSNLWLTLWVTRSPKGDFFVLLPRAQRKWTPHASYHQSGTHHMKSYDHVSVRRQGQPLTASFKGPVNLGCFAGHATNLATCDPALFDGIVEVAPGVLGPTGGTVCVDLVEPGCQPVTALKAHKIVQREIFTNLEPHVVITIYSPDPD